MVRKRGMFSSAWIRAVLALILALPVFAQDAPRSQGTPVPEAVSTVVAPIRSNPAHYDGEFTVAGPYELDPDAIREKYRTSADKFGFTTVVVTPSKTVEVRDIHYRLENGTVGIRPIPVTDDGKVTAPNGRRVAGYQVADDFIRDYYRHHGSATFKAGDPIFGFMAYNHPELNRGTISEMAGGLLKTEGGQTHLGMYMGEGVTRNSPQEYHSREFQVAGYPANLGLISLEGVSQATLNRNGHIATALLNDGVKFPGDYKNDVFKTVNLKETLAFYKGWIEDDPKYRGEEWATYCAEHVTIVTNIMLNVPHNLESFKEIWGAQQGALLFKRAKDRYLEVTGEEMPETKFTPLWKQDGIANPAAETEVGKGLAWRPETTADVVANFVEVYSSFPDVGAPASVATILAFKNTVLGRMADPEDVEDQKRIAKAFDDIAGPIMGKIILAEAMTRTKKFRATRTLTPDQLVKAYKDRTAERLYEALGGKREELRPGATRNAALWKIADSVTDVLIEKKDLLVGKPQKTVDQAWAWMRQAIAPDLQKARELSVSNPSRSVQFISPPAIIHRIASGMHPSHPKVRIVEVGTLMDASELRLKSGAPAGEGILQGVESIGGGQ